MADRTDGISVCIKSYVRFIGLVFGVSLALLCLLSARASVAQGDDAVGLDTRAETDPFLFVPELDGALMFDICMTQRVDLSGFPLAQLVPDLGFGLDLGYRHYLDIWGQLSLAGYLLFDVEIPSPFGGLGSGSGGDSRTGSVYDFGLGVDFTFRAMNDRFVYLLFGSYAELNAVVWTGTDALPQAGVNDSDPATGWRLAMGVSSGFGWLLGLDPYIYYEIPIFFGVQRIQIENGDFSALEVGVRFRVDWVFK